jgi:hypothetical protein
MEIISMTKEDLEGDLDLGKIIILWSLVREGLLNEKVADEWASTHTNTNKAKLV